MRKIIVLIFIIGIAYTGYNIFKATGSHSGMPSMGAMPVGAAKVVSKDISEWDEFSGRLEAVNRVEIRPRVGGTIEAVHFTEGQMIKKGDLLFTIDQNPYLATLKAAKAAAVYADAEFERAAKLLPQNAISKHEYDDKKNAADNADAALTKAELDLGYTRIRAPFSGRVNRAEITVGNLVNGGGEAPVLTTIVSLDPIYASFDIDEKNYIRYLHANDEDVKKMTAIPVKLALSGDSDFTYEGHIHSIDNELDTRSGTVRVRGIFDNKGSSLIPGLYTRVKVNGTGRHNAILIAESSITTDQNRKLVFMVGADNKVQAQEVKLGPVADGLRVVTEGLKENDVIVVEGLQRVRPGAEVKPQMVSMETEKEKK
jgi:multidrug efflux system membrane fusion protein